MGRFIVLDGNEGCGKSTQARLLVDRLSQEGIDTLLLRDPGSTRIGEAIRTLLLDPANSEMAMRCEMLLYMAARAQLVAEHISPGLAAGKTVVCDRFVSSTLAYQLGGEGLSEQEICATAAAAIHGRWPDLTLILDMPLEISLTRVNRSKDRIEQRPIAYHEQVRRNFLTQVAKNPARYRLVDATGSIEQVQARVWAALKDASLK